MINRILAVNFLISIIAILPQTPGGAADKPALSAPLPIGEAWTDRRPIAQYFISQAQYVTKLNPGGYLNKEVNVSTEAGNEAFRKLLLESADRWIGIMKEADAQGMVVWDLEGYQQASMVYVGDPRILPDYSPEMNAVADEFFKKFLAAGLRTGVCIRPNKIFLIPPEGVAKWGKWGYLIYDDRKDDVVKEVSERIAYAKKRWGCTIFYMDTNSYDTWEGEKKKSVTIPASMLQALRKIHPDVLIIPEHPTPGGHEWTAQYRELRGGWKGTPAAERQKYPGAFSVLSLGGGSEGLLEQNWEAIANSLAQGDAAFMEGWYPSEGNRLVKNLYRQAAYQKTALPAGTDLKSASALLKLLDYKDQAVRFLAVRALGTIKDTAQAEALMAIAAKDADWLVQKEAVVALGLLHDTKSIPVLAGLVQSNKSGIHFFARDALCQFGNAALSTVQGWVAGKDPRLRGDAAMILGKISDPQAGLTLCTLLADTDLQVRNKAAAALVERPDACAVEPLIKLVDSERYWPTRELALRALGASGAPAARETLTRYLNIEDPDGNAKNKMRYAAKDALKILDAELGKNKTPNAK